MDFHRSRKREEATAEPPTVATHDTYDDGAFEALIAPLPETARSALRLRFVDDLDYDGIGARLGCSTVAAPRLEPVAAAAVRGGLADAVFPRLPTPLGRLLVVEGPEGLVRIAFPEEAEDDVLVEVARVLGPNVIGSDRE